MMKQGGVLKTMLVDDVGGEYGGLIQFSHHNSNRVLSLKFQCEILEILLHMRGEWSLGQPLFG